MDDQLGILASIVQKLYEEGLRAAYAYANTTLGLGEDIDDLIAQTEEHIKVFS